MEQAVSSRVRFGDFELDLKTGELCSTTNRAQKTLLREQPFQVLRMLIERAGKIITREEIRRTLWPGSTIVDFDHSINVAIGVLRKALGDSAASPQYIETLARRGYRLKTHVEWLEQTTEIPPRKVAGTPRLGGLSELIGKKVSRYRVIRVLGGGGMGMVFEADDLKLGRRVALKFLPEEMAADPIALQRFEREAQTASALNHPNICTIHSVEDYQGQPFIVMELLEGETLLHRLEESKPNATPVNLLLNIAKEVCDGLRAAHEKDIIHRDIKPANVFLTKQGRVKILDFGLAKLAESEALEEDSSDADQNSPWSSRISASLTRTGTTAGTAGYMSPEQVRREKLDARTDLFSFGLVLYEMATGRQPFAGPTMAGVHDAILTQTPVSAHDVKSSVPRRLDVVIKKALEKNRAQRYQSAAEMRRDLERVSREIQPARRIARWSVAALAMLSLVAVGIWRYEVYRHRITLGPTDTIVLADVDNQTGDPVFDDALNTALRYEMAQTPYLNVLGIDKAYATLAQLNLPPTTKIAPDVARQICAKTNSKMVISQSIADAGNGYRLQMRALECASGAILAEEQEDIGSRNEVVHELGVIAVRLRAKLGEPADSLARFNQPLEKALSASLEALQAGTQGTKLHFANDVAGAVKLYQRAVELDPNLAMTYEGLGAAYHFLGNLALSEASFTRAYQLRDRLTERDRLNLELIYYGNVVGDLEKELSSARRFIEIFPRDVFVHNNLAFALSRLGEPDRAADEAAEAARLQPSAYYFGFAIRSWRLASRFIEAKSWLAKADALKFDNPEIWHERLVVLFATGDRDGVEKILNEEERGSYREDFLLAHAVIEIQQGRFQSAERLRQQSSKAATADWRAALENAEVGREVQARRYESKLAQSNPNRNDKLALALALARSGQVEEAAKLADMVSAERPEDTQVQNYLVPTIRAAIKLQQHDPATAIDLLSGTVKYDLAFTNSFDFIYPAFIRGLAYLELGDGRSAAAQFQKMIDNRGLTIHNVIGPLAWLQLGRAQKMMGDEAAARRSYETFLALWKDADPDLPVYQQAKAEYAKLRKG